MSLHLTLFTSTLCPSIANLRGWQSAAMLVEFLFGGRYSSIEERTSEFKNHINQDGESLAAVDPQLNTHSGRYRRQSAVPT